MLVIFSDSKYSDQNCGKSNCILLFLLEMQKMSVYLLFSIDIIALVYINELTIEVLETNALVSCVFSLLY